VHLYQSIPKPHSTESYAPLALKLRLTDTLENIGIHIYDVVLKTDSKSRDASKFFVIECAWTVDTITFVDGSTAPRPSGAGEKGRPCADPGKRTREGRASGAGDA
jgi:hypothetical protein